MKRTRAEVQRTDPSSDAVRAAERLVLAGRSPLAAEIGAEDSSIGDLITVLIGANESAMLQEMATELRATALAMEAECDMEPPQRFDGHTLVEALGRRASAAAEIHRRIRAARAGR